MKNLRYTRWNSLRSMPNFYRVKYVHNVKRDVVVFRRVDTYYFAYRPGDESINTTVMSALHWMRPKFMEKHDHSSYYFLQKCPMKLGRVTQLGLENPNMEPLALDIEHSQVEGGLLYWEDAFWVQLEPMHLKMRPLNSSRVSYFVGLSCVQKRLRDVGVEITTPTL